MDTISSIVRTSKKMNSLLVNYYLTDNVIVRDKKMYVEKEKNDKSVLYKINKNNWHNYAIIIGKFDRIKMVILVNQIAFFI